MTTPILPPTPSSILPEERRPLPFEGVEKRLILEVDPEAFDGSKYPDFKAVDVDTWNLMLQSCRCKILGSLQPSSHQSVEESLDEDSPIAFLLSESTLMVWKHRILVKTCGTTAPLMVLAALTEHIFPDASLFINSVKMALYTRFELLFPEQQFYPHRSFSEELEFLSLYFDPSQAEHHISDAAGRPFYVYCYGPVDKMCECRPFVSTEILMLGIDGNCQEQFRSNCLPRLVEENGEVDEYFFTPCGYSCNVVSFKTGDFADVHISPEPSVSYASIEMSRDISSVTEDIDKVTGLEKTDFLECALSSFKAEKFCVGSVQVNSGPRYSTTRNRAFVMRRGAILISFLGGPEVKDDESPYPFCHMVTTPSAISTSAVSRVETICPSDGFSSDSEQQQAALSSHDEDEANNSEYEGFGDHEKVICLES